MTNAKTFLEKRYVLIVLPTPHIETLNTLPDVPSYNDDISLEDAIHTALLTLKEGFEGQLTEKTIEIGVIGGFGSTIVKGTKRTPAFRKLTESEVKDYLASPCLFSFL
jgi:20S proteasome alpha/beta subunit